MTAYTIRVRLSREQFQTLVEQSNVDGQSLEVGRSLREERLHAFVAGPAIDVPVIVGRRIERREPVV